MKESVKRSLKDVAVLVVIAAVSGLLLGLFNRLTYVDPKREAMKKFGQICPQKEEYVLVEESPAEGVLYVAESGNVTAVLSTGAGGYKGKVQTYVFFEGGRIFLIVPGENGETYLNKLDEAGYYKQFYGASAESYDAAAIDAVTGATRSSTAVKNAVEAALSYYKIYEEARRG